MLRHEQENTRQGGRNQEVCGRTLRNSPALIFCVRIEPRKKAACERYVEKIAEALTDLAFLAIKGKKLAIPEDDIDAFRILQESGLIEPSIAQKMRNVKGMRNIIAHQYGTIDDEVIFHSVKEELGKDALAFSERIRKGFQP